MLDRPCNQVPDRGPAQVSRLEENAGGVLTRIDVLAAVTPLCDLRRDALHGRMELPLVVERRHHNMTPLPPRGVVPIVTDDEAGDAVVLRVNLRHSARLRAFLLSLRHGLGRGFRGLALPDGPCLLDACL
jgi:hypothetical protein